MKQTKTQKRITAVRILLGSYNMARRYANDKRAESKIDELIRLDERLSEERIDLDGVRRYVPCAEYAPYADKVRSIIFGGNVGA